MIHIAFDHTQNTIYAGNDHRSGLHSAVFILIQEDNIACGRQITADNSVSLAFLPTPLHNLSA